jgi:hypothetical protein
MQQTLDLNDGQWCTLGPCLSLGGRASGEKSFGLESGDFVIVVYDVPPTAEAREFNVWYGGVAISAAPQRPILVIA